MRKSKVKLGLSRETLRILDRASLNAAAGGFWQGVTNCCASATSNCLASLCKD